MSDDRSGFITPPPGLLPAAPPPPATPPTESGTRRMPLGARAGVPTPIVPPRPVPTPSAPAAPPPPPAPTPLVEPAETHTPAPVPAPTPLVEPAETRTPDSAPLVELAETHAPDPVLGQAGVITRSSAAIVWSLALPHGAPSVTLTGTAVLGRAPTPVPAAPGAALVALADPAKSVSKNHLLLEPEGAEVWVTDLGSTNGTVAVAPDGTPTELPVGIRSRVASGSTLQLGEFDVVVARR